MPREILTPPDNLIGAKKRLKATKILSKSSKSINLRDLKLARTMSGKYVVIGTRVKRR